MNTPAQRDSAPDLRQRAEDRLAQRGMPAPRGEADVRRLLHELQVHQIELEMQNDALHEALHAVEAGQRFTDLYEFAPIAYVSLRADGCIQLLNEAATRLLQMERASAIGRPLADGIDAGLRPAFNAFLHRVLTQSGIATCESVLRPTTSGAAVNVRIEAVADAHRLNCNLAMTDITALKTVETALQAAKVEAERANEAKSRFLAAASHDLRQPLAALSLYIGVLKNRIGPIEEPLFNSVHKCVVGLNELLSDLLDLSKLDAGVVKPEISDFSVADLLTGLTAVHAPEAQLKGLTFRWRSSRLHARTDPVLYRRLLGNLIANAIHYTRRGGVLIAVRRRQGKTWIEVWDTGIGIPEDKFGEIFEEFRSLDRNERNRGSGLGLAIVARSADLLGLQLRFCSRIGHGSMFAVELPLGRRRGAAVAHSPRHRGLRIALVEDNGSVLDALGCALEALGHEVVAALSQKELFVRLAGQAAPDMVISDYRLADGQTGLEVVAALRKVFGDTLPALLVTGDTDPQLLRRMADRGIAIRHKPLEIGDLEHCIAALTGHGQRVSKRGTSRKRS